MDLNQIETDLHNSDFQYRLKAIAALQDHRVFGAAMEELLP